MGLMLGSLETPRDHLIIPDVHAVPGENTRRYDWLAEVILERQPEVIVNIGDAWEMGSLCSYDKGKREFIFKNVKDDIEAGHKAEEHIFGPIIKYNNTRSQWKKKQYRPLILKFIGNHEYRVARLLQYETRWDGSVSMDSFNTRLDIDERVIDFLNFAVIDDIAYSHYFVSGTQGRPFASARAMLAKKGMSCTMGHSHVLDFANFVKPTGEMCRGLICGSYHDPDYASFAGPQVDLVWFNGLIYKHHVLNGDYDHEELSTRRLMKMFEGV